MRVVFKTNLGIQATLDMTPTEAEQVLAGVNFSRETANTFEINDTEGRTINIRTTDITSIEFIY